MAKILLVEDDKSLREIYGVRLLAEGYDIISAGDGEEALAMAIRDQPDLILSDVMMPKISGFDMLDILRSTAVTKDVKVIMMTALSSDDQRERGEQLGADRYLVKSQVGIEDVVRTVHEVLGDAPVVATGNIFAAPAPTAVAQPNPVTPASPVAPSPVANTTTTPVTTGPAVIPAPTTVNAPQQPAAASSLPQPTAPFSTSRPASLGERVIQPIEKPQDSGPHIADLIDQELQSSASTGSTVSTSGQPSIATQPAVTTAPSPAPVSTPPSNGPAAAPEAPNPPVPPAPVMDSAQLNYEETSSTVQTQQQPPATV